MRHLNVAVTQTVFQMAAVKYLLYYEHQLPVFDFLAPFEAINELLVKIKRKILFTNSIQENILSFTFSTYSIVVTLFSLRGFRCPYKY